jgi:beta-galactosidase
MNQLTYDREHFYLDQVPFHILSGTIHYFRVVPEYWEDRLRKLKECGMNTVETYTCWNLHERKEGEFDFTGILDLERFILTAKKLGLYLILRPGPYICAEWDMGGLPSWLLNIPNIRIRCCHDKYLEKVRNYYRELFRIVRPHLANNGGNIIAVQIENEYGSYGDDHDYMQAIVDIYKENQVDCTLFTSDGPGYFMLNGGSVKDYLATINFGSNPKDNFSLLKRYRPDQPVMCTEYWNGWFDHWYGEHHTRSGGDTADTFEEMVVANAAVNFYMFHGGTNFGFMNGANYFDGLQPTITSYDYNCPVSESGDLTEKYYAIRSVMELHYGSLPPLTVHNLPKMNYGAVELTKKAEMFTNLGVLSSPVTSSYPQTMEELGQDFGFLLYKTTLKGPFETMELTIDGLQDRAHIYLNGKLLGIKENTGKRDDKIEVGLDFNEEAELLILVENLGRVNYGGHICDQKGILKGIRIGSQYHFGWTMYPITCDDISRLSYASAEDEKKDTMVGPLFLKGTFEVKDKADSFVELPGFTKGCVFINGFNLGRYWNSAGPQKTLYLPAPLLKEGSNEIVVLELDGYTNDVVQLIDQENLG